MRITQWNIKGVKEWKLGHSVFGEMVATNDIIVLTETHLVGEGSIKKAMPQGSRLFTVDGSTSRGGVAVWVSQRIAGNVVLLGKSEIPKGMESIWIKLKG